MVDINHSLFSKTRTKIVVYSVIFMTLIYIVRLQELLPATAKLQAAKIAAVFSLILYSISPKRHNEPSILAFPQSKYILGILLFSLLSIPLSTWTRLSSYTLWEYFKIMFFLYLLVKTIDNTLELRRLIFAIVFGIFLLGIAMTKVTGAERASVSLAYNPNDIAALIAICLPIIYFMIINEKGLRRIWCIATGVLMLYALVRTVSRSGFCGLVFICMLILIKDRKFTLKSFMFLLAFLAIVYFAPSSYWERINTITNLKVDYNMTDPNGRIEIWKRGLQLMFKHPLFGVGVGTFAEAEGVSGGQWMAAHNSYIEIGAELGMIGLCLFISLIGSSIRVLQKLQKRINENPVLKENLWLINGVEISLYTYAFQSLFGSISRHPILYFLIAITMILRKFDLQKLKSG